MKNSKLGKIALATIVSASVIPMTSPLSAEASEDVISPEWIKNVGTTGSDSVRTMKQTSDGGFVIASVGYVSSGGYSYEEAILTKYDQNGNQLWTTKISGNKSDSFYDVIETSDGGFVAVGHTNSTDLGFTLKGSSDAFIVKFNANGKKQWLKPFIGNTFDHFSSVTQTTDGGFIAVGTSSSTDVGFTNKGREDAILVKYDANGNQKWVKSINGRNNDEIQRIIPTTDGGYLVAGHSDSSDLGYTYKGSWDMFFVKYDKNGNKEWMNNFSGNKTDYFYDIIQTTDGGYLAVGTVSSTDAGFTNKGSGDAVLIKFDSNGNQKWLKSMGGSGDDKFNSVVQTADGGFIATGTTTSKDEGFEAKGGTDMLIAKFDSNGEKLWTDIVGGTGSEYMGAVAPIKDGGYLVAGSSSSKDTDFYTNKGGSDILLLKYTDDYIKPDTIAPTIEVTPNLTEFTNQNVLLQANATDNEGGSGVKSITLPDGTIVTGESVTFEATTNGDYIFIVEDVAGNTTTKTVSVTNIDKLNPNNPIFTVLPGSISLEAGTDIGSGVKEVQVSLNGGEFVPYTDLLSLPDGDYTVSAKTVDLAGNESDVVTLHVTLYGEQLQEAKNALVQAQSEGTQDAVNNAVESVSLLPATAPETQEFAEVLVTVQEEVTSKAVESFVTESTVENYEEALESIESLQSTTQALQVSNETVSQVNTLEAQLVNQVQSSESNLISDNTTNGKAVGDAVKFIQKVEQKSNKGLLKVCQNKIDALEEGTVKNSLQKRLDSLN